MGFPHKYYNINGIWALKAYCLGPRTLEVGFGSEVRCLKFDVLWKGLVDAGPHPSNGHRRTQPIYK